MTLYRANRGRGVSRRPHPPDHPRHAIDEMIAATLRDGTQPEPATT
jgi:hypothetical protein